MKKTLLFFLFLLSSIFFYAQAPAYSSASRAGSTNMDYGKTIFTDSHRNVYVAGVFKWATITFGSFTLTNANFSYTDFFLVKYDSLGNVLWAKRGGGISDEVCNSLTVDNNGNVYITGTFGGTMTIGSTTLTPLAGMPDIFVIKYDSAGNVVWAKREGGTSVEFAEGISNDKNGNVLITGYFVDSMTVGSTLLPNASGSDLYLIKYDSLGNVIWANNYGGTNTVRAYSVTTDTVGNVYVAGSFSGTFTLGSITLTNINLTYLDFFIVKFNSGGTPLWARSAGESTKEDHGRSVKTDSNGNVYCTGSFGSGTIVFGGFTLTKPGSGIYTDAFLVKYDSLGTALWAKGAGGSDSEVANDISVDASGNVYQSGYYNSPSVTFGSSTLVNPNAPTKSDIFLFKYDASGNPMWGKSFISNGNDRCNGVSSYSDGLVYITGYFDATSSVFDAITLTNAGASGTQDVFIAKLCDFPSPIITTSGPITFCTGDSVTLDAGSGQSSYSWSNGATTQNITVFTSGTYTVTVSNPAGCTSTASIVVTVTPFSILTPSDLLFCNGDIIPLLSFTSTPSGASISWTNTNTAIGIPASGTGNIPSFSAVNTGVTPIVSTINVTASGISGCPPTSNSFTITINPPPDATFSYSSTTYCQLDPDPTPTVSGGVLGYYFYSSPGLVFVDSITGEIDLLASAGNTYTITHVSSLTCQDTSTFSLTINPIPTVNAGLDGSVCAGGYYTLNGTIGGGATTILWSSLGTGTFDNDTLVYASYYPSAADTLLGSATLIATTNSSLSGCGGPAKDTIVITINTCSTSGIVGSDAYIKGKHVEIGLNGLGGFEGADTIVSPLLAGMHHRSHAGGQNFFGFVANPQLDNWATFDGDFYTPGSPENGWGFEIDTAGGIKAGNNCAFLQEINGAITSWSYVTPYYSSDWEGDYLTGTNLHFKINTTLHEDALFYTTTVSITNNTSSTIPELYYYKNIDPDNNVSLYYATLGPPAYMTINTIVRQGGTGDTAQVTAVQNVPRHSYFSLAGLDTNWRACYGGFSNRDASDLWYGTSPFGISYYTALGSSDSMDAAISLSRKIQNFLPSTTRTFRFCTIFTDSASDCAIASLSANLPAFGTICSASAPFVLSGGAPAGGTYSGPGVVNDTMFDPGVSGIGTFNIAYTVDDSSGCQKYATSSIQVDLCTGVSKPSETSSISMSVYPNPNNGNFNVMFTAQEKSNYKLELRNVLGQVVYQETLPDFIGTYSKPISVSNFGKGVYTITLTNDKQDVIKKIIVY